MKSYIDIVNRILFDGKKKETRAGDTITVPNVFWEHDMADGFPLLTTRKMPIKSIAVELEGFIKGITSKKWFQERGCRFWDNWANPHIVSDVLMEGTKNGEFMIVEHVQKVIDNLGPLGYSYQMRRFNEVFDEDDDGQLKGVDQLKELVDTLKTNPNDRRMVVSYWNPPQLSRMALPPCTVAWAVNVTDGKLHLSWFQRSCDFLIGGSTDIASMAIMQMLLCKESGLLAGKLSALFVDCHIYEKHLPAARELVFRESKDSPRFIITSSKQNKFSIFDWTHKDYILTNYNPHPKLDIGEIAV